MRSDSIISSGNIIALWQILILAKDNPTLEIKTAVGAISSRSTLGGSIPIDGGIKVGTRYKFLEITEGNIILIEQITTHLFTLCTDELPNVNATRVILQSILKYDNCDWLVHFDEDPDIFKTGIPKDWLDLLENAELFNFEDDNVIDWWKLVFSRYTKYKEGAKLEVGKIAEKLSFDHEESRLLPILEREKNSIHVKWVSEISDRFGFDILSIRGGELKHSKSEKDKIQIEVKSSTFDDLTKFRFYVSRNEWETAFRNLNDYFFYCWASVSIEKKESAIGPFIIPASKLQPLIPSDSQPSICSWSECRFIVDLSSLKIN